MKKWIFGISSMILSVALLSACGEDNTENVRAEEDVTGEKVDMSDEQITVLANDNIEEIVGFVGTGEGDKLISAEIDGEEVKAVIELASSDLLTDEQYVLTRYSQASDGLLEYEYWKTLSIEYVGIATISLDRSEAVANEFGLYYFPEEIIADNLN